MNRYHRQYRMAWAKPIKTWTLDNFKYIIWSDECYVHMGGSPGSVYVSRSPDEADLEECFVPYFKLSSVRVMVWACIMLGHKGPIKILDYPSGRGGGMNAERYQSQVLDNALLDFYTQVSLEEGWPFSSRTVPGPILAIQLKHGSKEMESRFFPTHLPHQI